MKKIKKQEIVVSPLVSGLFVACSSNSSLCSPIEDNQPLLRTVVFINTSAHVHRQLFIGGCVFLGRSLK
ncbi:hypothetical protein PanWU01x14_052870 [Parasponia andersonii]|uniref:Lipoprotein n=1 Tax=Parasponia andersonii TaxID=3476 RepID=A0A2P5DLA4_PARAD|nr:hypothetical protein PanWU01x14_052870 [Parasponia andersonii]